MNEEQVADQAAPRDAPAKKLKKQASWVRTILWMLSMMLLVNLAMLVVFWVWWTFWGK